MFHHSTDTQDHPVRTVSPLLKISSSVVYLQEQWSIAWDAMNMMHSLMFGQKCPNYHLNDTLVVIMMITIAAVINKIMLPIINMTSHGEIMGIMYCS